MRLARDELVDCGSDALDLGPETPQGLLNGDDARILLKQCLGRLSLTQGIRLPLFDSLFESFDIVVVLKM